MFGREIIAYLQEIEPASIEEIIARFSNEEEREKQKIVLEKTIQKSPIIWGMVYVSGEKFVQKTSLEKCSSGNLIVLAFLLTGQTNPTDFDRLRKVFCGQTIVHEETMGIYGPLSGRSGDSYVPFSQCWRIANDLQKLILYMEETEEVPILPDTDQNWQGQLERLKEYEKIKNKRQRQGFVIIAWEQTVNQFSEINPKSAESLASGVEQGEAKALVKKNFDPSLQFDIGGEKYKEIVYWIKEKVFLPLANLVGDRYLNPIKVEGGKITFPMDFRKTARNCPLAPEEGFIGRIS